MNLRARVSAAWQALRGDETSRAAGSLTLANSGLTPYIPDAGGRTRPGDHALLGAYRSLMWACANINARAVARVPLRLYVVTAAGQARPRSVPTRAVPRATHRRLAERLPHAAMQLARSADNVVEEVMEHPVLEALRKPARIPHSPFKGPKALAYFAQVGKEVLGRSFWRFSLDDLGMPRDLLPLPPASIEPVFFSEARPDGRFVDYFSGPKGERIPADRVAWFRVLDLRDPYRSAYGPAAAAFHELGLIDKFDDAAAEAFDRAFHPDVVVSPKNPDRPLGKEAGIRLESDLAKRFGKDTRALGKKKGNRAIVEDSGALDIKDWPSPKADSAAAVISKAHRQAVANCFDIPLTLLETSTSNKASAEAGNAAHLTNAVAPRCELLAEELTGWMHDLAAADVDPAGNGPLGWDRAFLAFDDPTPADEEKRSKVLVGYVGSGILLPDEARAEIDYGPRPDGKGMEGPQDKPAPGEEGDDQGGKPKPADEDDDE